MKKLVQFIFILFFIFCSQYQSEAQQFGYTTWDGSKYLNPGYITWWKIETGSSDSGDFTHVGFYQNSTDEGGDMVKMGIYEDNGSNAPGSILVETASFNITLDTYNQIELVTPVAFDPSTIYWVAVHCNVRTGFGELASGSVAIKYKSLTFGSAWPDPAGNVSGYTEDGGNFYAIGNGEIVLPVELIQFQVERKNEMPNLTWSTATEVNNEGWNIQRSQNGFTWNTIYWVDGSGNSYSTNNYEYLDKKPTNGLNFYRLEQVDYDGEKSYTEVQSFMHKTTNRSIYPNPAVDKINLSGYGASSVTINNMRGKIILSTLLQEGEELNIKDLLPGHYLMVIEENETLFTHQFIKE